MSVAERPDPAQIWTSICGAEHGVAVGMVVTMLATIPPEVFGEAIRRLGRETTLGPMLDPTAWLDGRRADNATFYVDVLRRLGSVAWYITEANRKTGGSDGNAKSGGVA